MRTLALLTIGGALTGCAMSNGVQKVGPETYMVSAVAAPVRGGVSGAQTVALADANRYCAEQGREIMVTNTAGGAMNNIGAGQANITFHCLERGDRDLRRPNLQTAPSIVIEDRRN